MKIVNSKSNGLKGIVNKLFSPTFFIAYFLLVFILILYQFSTWDMPVGETNIWMIFLVINIIFIIVSLFLFVITAMLSFFIKYVLLQKIRNFFLKISFSSVMAFFTFMIISWLFVMTIFIIFEILVKIGIIKL